MTTQLPSRERLELLANPKLECTTFSKQERAAMARFVLAAHEQEPVAWRYRTTDMKGNPNPDWSFSETESLLGLYEPLYTHPAPVPAVPMAVAGFDAATAIRACMEEFPESMRDIVEECAQIAENTISTSHAAPVHAVPELVSIIGELTSAIRSINRASHHIAKGVDDDEPCYWQRKEWIDWILELASSADEKSRAAMLNGGKS